MAEIASEAMIGGYPEQGVRYPEPFVSYAAFAAPNGALGLKVEQAAGVRPAIQHDKISPLGS